MPSPHAHDHHRPDPELRRLHERYESLALEIPRLGFMIKGSVAQRLLTCGSKGCRCHADPPQLHGPYWQWTSKVKGKTVSRMLSEDQARRYQEWIKNWRRFDSIVHDLFDVASQVDAILRAQEREERQRTK